MKLFISIQIVLTSGVAAEKVLLQAKERISSMLSIGQKQMLFSSGATESNNIALKGIAYRKSNLQMKLLLPF